MPTTKITEPKILWKDRKRYLGMPLSFTKYSIENDRLYIQKGFFKTEVNEILLYRILDVKSKRTLWQKIFGVGTISIFSADASDKTIDLQNIKNCKKVHRFISDTVEKERTEKRILGKEIYGASSMHECDCDDVSFEDYE